MLGAEGGELGSLGWRCAIELRLLTVGQRVENVGAVLLHQIVDVAEDATVLRSIRPSQVICSGGGMATRTTWCKLMWRGLARKRGWEQSGSQASWSGQISSNGTGGPTEMEERGRRERNETTGWRGKSKGFQASAEQVSKHWWAGFMLFETPPTNKLLRQLPTCLAVSLSHRRRPCWSLETVDP
jgi:hypothetical protein